MKKVHTLKASQIVAGYDQKIIIDGIDLVIPDSKISVIIGANACGKSTLLKTLARLIKPKSGELHLGDKSLKQMPPRHLSRILGLLPQSPIVPDGITVADLVARGRFPYRSFFKVLSHQDYLVVEEALETMGIKELANRSVDELSGGQRQRVWIAMALAQQTEILLLDEPTTYLDIAYQIEILDLLTDLNKKHGTTIVMVLHDINLSSRYADHIFALYKGTVVAEGAPSEIITENLIKKIFDLNCSVITDPESGTPFVIPRGRHHVKDKPVALIRTV